MDEAAPQVNGDARVAGGMRVMLLTDTLGDVNGPARFVGDMAAQARRSGRALTVVTSTRMECPRGANIVNLRARAAMRMPRYEQLELVAPPIRRVMDLVRLARPDAVHISTPGPVGIAGWIAARRLRIPMVGTYHTDFPAYIERLFDDAAMTWATRAYVRGFYAPFARILTRSAEYAKHLVSQGVSCRRIKTLRAGTDTEAFHPRHRSAAVWAGVPGVRADSVKVLYVGRVSVEKNMPLLARVWAEVAKVCEQRGLAADLIVVGDGPHRGVMEAELRSKGVTNVHFAGFRHGLELAALYASSDFFVFPSTTDTLGQVVLEAQASGLPAIVSMVGGPKEVVRHGRTGFVVEPENPRAWVEAIVSLIVDGERRRMMGAAAHEWMQSHSIKDSFEHFWELHEGVRRIPASDACKPKAKTGRARQRSAGESRRVEAEA